MFRKIILPLLAICGVVAGIFMIYWSSRTPAQSAIIFSPPRPPYTHYVVGEGLVEALDDNVNLGVAFPELVTETYVEEGAFVTKDTPLFKLDTQQLEADLSTAIKEYELAQTEAKNRCAQFSFYESLNNKNAVSQLEYTQAFFAQQEALDRVQVAQAHIEQIKTRIYRSVVRAPSDGVILQKSVNAGEFANINPFSNQSYIVFGNENIRQIRVQIAEEDAWRVIPGAPATAYVRGNSDIQFPITFKKIEPLIVPKTSLTGADFERIDTRVLEILYVFDMSNLPVYTGQLLNVYIEAKPQRYHNGG